LSECEGYVMYALKGEQAVTGNYNTNLAPKDIQNGQIEVKVFYENYLPIAYLLTPQVICHAYVIL
jgi:hypothetical protein